MSEESKKVEKAEKNEQEVKPAELSEQDLDRIARLVDDARKGEMS